MEMKLAGTEVLRGPSILQIEESEHQKLTTGICFPFVLVSS